MLTKKTKKQNKKTKSLKINDKVQSSPKILADFFNNFFVTIVENIDKKIVHTNSTYKDYMKNSVTNSFFFKLLNEEEENSFIKQMKTNKRIARAVSQQKY